MGYVQCHVGEMSPDNDVNASRIRAGRLAAQQRANRIAAAQLVAEEQARVEAERAEQARIDAEQTRIANRQWISLRRRLKNHPKTHAIVLERLLEEIEESKCNAKLRRR